MTFRDDDGDRIECLDNPRGAEEQKGLIRKKSIVVKSRKKRTLPKWLDRPYHVWRDQFQQEKCCPKKMVKRELIIASCSILFPNLFLAIFIFFGTRVFNLQFTNSEKIPSLMDAALFCVTTISTIGYGNIVPVDDRDKIVCLLYCVVGIPLFFLTLITNSMFFQDLCHILQKSFSSKPTQDDIKFNWYTCGILLTIHCFIGSLMFSLWIDEFDFLDAFYFSFISITTIGYGDFCPSPEGPVQYTALILYLCIGVAIISLFFARLQDVIMWIHYFGRKVSDSEDAEIWYGGQMIHVKDLVKVVAEKFGSTPEKLRDVMHDLDKILEVACKQAEDNSDDNDEESCRLVQNSENMVSPAGIRKKTIFLTGSTDNEDNQATIHSFTSTNQKSIPKDTELAIVALGTIQHHLRKPSVRAKTGHHPKIPSRQTSENNMETKMHATSLDLRKMAHRVHSDGRLLDQNDA